MTDRELMQQALDALEFLYIWTPDTEPVVDDAITAMRERLAQPEMQPCAGRNCGSTNPNLHSAECFEDYEKSTGMNQWQGLTDEEREQVINANFATGLWQMAKDIEVKLKEKNT